LYSRSVSRTGTFVFVVGASHSPWVHGSPDGLGLGTGVGVGVGAGDGGRVVATFATCSRVGDGVALGWVELLPQATPSRETAPTATVRQGRSFMGTLLAQIRWRKNDPRHGTGAGGGRQYVESPLAAHTTG
jgi:hypothetical protein